VRNYATEFLVKFGKFWNPGFELGIFVPHRQDKTPLPNSPIHDNLSYCFQVGYQIAPNLGIGLKF
jgi:hypothetical protein